MNAVPQRILILLVAAVALAAGVFFKQQQKSGAPTADAGSRLQSLSLPDLHGTPQPLAQWRGKKWVVNFWATWCAPCREEMPLLARLSKAHAETTQFIGIGIDTPEAMLKFIDSTPVPYPLLTADNEILDLTAALGNKAMALPFTVVLDEKGRIVWQHVGLVSEAELTKILSAAGK